MAVPKKAGKQVESKLRGAVGDMRKGSGKSGAMAKRAEATLEARKPKKK